MLGFTRRAAPLALALGALLAFAPGALADQRVIASAGPLTNIYLNDDLACSAEHVGDTSPEFYGGTENGSCGTLLSTGETTYGPVVGAPPTPVSQSGVTGSGTASDPFQVVTVVDAGRSGLRITQTDAYVVGQESYRTDVTVANSTDEPIDASLYHAGDCYLQDSDFAYGFHDPTTGGIFCSVNAEQRATGPDRRLRPVDRGEPLLRVLLRGRLVGPPGQPASRHLRLRRQPRQRGGAELGAHRAGQRLGHALPDHDVLARRRDPGNEAPRHDDHRRPGRGRDDLRHHPELRVHLRSGGLEL